MSWLGPNLNTSIEEIPCIGKYQCFLFLYFLAMRIGTRWEDPAEMDSCDISINKLWETLHLD